MLYWCYIKNFQIPTIYIYICQVWICIGLSIPTVMLSLFALSKYICALKKGMGSKQSKNNSSSNFNVTDYVLTVLLSQGVEFIQTKRKKKYNKDLPFLTRYLVKSYNLRWILFEETISDSFSGGCLVFGLFRSRSSLQFHSDRFHHVTQ